MDLERIVKQANIEIFTPLEASARQIDRAISLFLEEHDYICAITLACAADGILGEALLAQEKEPMINLIKTELQDIHFFSDISAKELSDQHLNKIRNLLKHCSGDLNKTIEHATDFEAISAIIRAVGNLGFVTENVSQKTIEFFAWLKQNYPEIFVEVAKYEQQRQDHP
jgi:hypothetical protein